MSNRVFPSFIVVLAITGSAFAVPHVNPDAYPEAKTCHVRTLSPAKVRAAGGSYERALISNATQPQKIAVILVNFPSASATVTSGSATLVDLTNIKNYFDSFIAYYREVSYDAMNLTNRVHYFGTGVPDADGALTPVGLTPYQLDQAMEFYGCGDVDNGCFGVAPVAPPGKGGAWLIRHAIQKVRNAGLPIEYTTSNTPGVGQFNAVLVMHAGYGNESTTGRNGDIWSAVYQEPGIIGPAGGNFEDGAVFPEFEAGLNSPMGVIAHEFGHILSLPDLYNTLSLGGQSVVGNWDLMDNGTYLGSGANPAHMGAWCKTTLGWVNPQVAGERGSFSLNKVATAQDILKIPVGNGLPQEYFLVEYRSRTAGDFDQFIPGDGLLVWHVDDQLTFERRITADDTVANTVNSGSPHYGVSIVTADGRTISRSNPGNASNAFGNDGVLTSPKSNNFNGHPSGVNLVSIDGIGGAAAGFQVVNLDVAAGQTVAKALAYPNPSGKGYGHPLGEGHATLTFHLVRPTSDYSANIYTLSGEIVREIHRGDIALNITRSDNLKWVYEYVWDLKNGDGKHVAPGVYLILVRADGKSKTAKAVVIR